MKETQTARKKVAARARLIASGAIIATLCSGGLADASENKLLPASTSTTALEQLVDRFEGITPFRGDGTHLPLDSSDGFQLGSVALYPAETDESPVRLNGFTSYGVTNAGYGVIAAGNGPDGDRVGFVVNDRSLETFSIDVGLAPGAVVYNDPDTGQIDILDGEALSTLEPATAVDANGSVIKARYQVIGDQLVVDVDLTEAALPVLIDPVISNQWWGHTDWYSRSEVRSFANAYQLVDVAKRGCNAASNTAARWVCQQTVGRYTGWISDTWQYAKNTNQCLSMSMTWTGTVTGLRAYPCNWG